jgi:hypothetical protein
MIDQLVITGLDDLIRRLDIAPAKLRRAVDRAASNTLRNARSSTAQAISAETSIPRRALKYRTYWSKEEFGGKLWIGLNPVAAAQRHVTRHGSTPLFKIRQDDHGASAGSYYFPGGFVLHTRGAGDKIVKRQGPRRIATEYVVMDTPGVLAAIERVKESAAGVFINEVYRLVQDNV